MIGLTERVTALAGRSLSLLALPLAATLFAGSASADGPAGAMCGGIAAIQCPKDEYCDHAVGICGKGDQSGACEARPQFCTREYRPVCGCDGKTYGNDCERRAAGASKLKDGACG